MNLKLVSFLIVILLVFNSCGLVRVVASSKITVQNKAIPPNFGTDNTYLICVITGKESYDKYMIKHVKNEFHGNYEFVLRRELHFKNYMDRSKYRYVFDSQSIDYQTFSASSGTQDIRTFQYNITDLKENIVYKCPITSSFYSKLIKAYMINLEKERISKIRD